MLPVDKAMADNKKTALISILDTKNRWQVQSDSDIVHYAVSELLPLPRWQTLDIFSLNLK